MSGLFPSGLVFLVAGGAAAGFPLAWLAGRFEGAARARRWVAALLPLALIGLAASTPPSAWAAGAVLTGLLIMIAVVDALTLRIPDLLSLPLLVIGLGLAAAGGTRVIDRVAGAALGFIALAILAWLYRALRRREGLGLGDAKLLAVGGAWLGWQGLPTVLLLAAGGGFLVLGGAMLRRGRAALAEAIPFGPPLAGAIWVAWLLAAGHRAI